MPRNQYSDQVYLKVYDPTTMFGKKEPHGQITDGKELNEIAKIEDRLEDGEEVRIINDDEVIGTVLNPDDIKAV